MPRGGTRNSNTMKTTTLIPLLAALAIAALPSCANPALKINTAAVQAQIIGDAEKLLLAGGGALLISGGNTGAAVAAITAQEMRNIPELQRVLDAQSSPKNPAAAVTP
jgi:hypothetical protein